MSNVFRKDPISREGFTLIEVIIAISVLTFGLLAVASMQITGIRGNAFARGTSEGTNRATDKIEKLIQKGLADYADFELEDTDGDGAAGLEDCTAGTADHQETAGLYTVYWNVADNQVMDNTKTVRVLVVWEHGAGNKQISLSHVLPRIQ